IIAGSSVPEQSKPDKRPATRYAVQLVGVDYPFAPDEEFQVALDAGEKNPGFQPAAVLIPTARNRAIDCNQLTVSAPVYAELGLDRRLGNEIDVSHPRVVDVRVRDHLTHVAPNLQRLVVAERKSTHNTRAQRIFRHRDWFEPIAKVTRDVIEHGQDFG